MGQEWILYDVGGTRSSVSEPAALPDRRLTLLASEPLGIPISMMVRL